jgi:uncharacterized protein (TIGR00661 family)
MKILYAVQATGNGHIARAIEILPYLKKYGDVDIFLSGSNSHLQVDLPVQYRSRGLSLFYSPQGKLDYWRIGKELQITSAIKEAMELPVQKYDLVINDFESITSLACRLRKKASIGFGHQASFQSRLTPRPAKKDVMGETILRYYGWAQQYVGLHFESYDEHIFNPIIKEKILQAVPKNNGHITVYLPHYGLNSLHKEFATNKSVSFEIFSPFVSTPYTEGNCRFFPVSNEAFTQSMIHSEGVITGAGFETPAETLYLGKKLMVLPIRGQYEQLCNAAAMEKRRVTVIDKIDARFQYQLQKWLLAPAPSPLTITHSTEQLVRLVIERSITAADRYCDTSLTPLTAGI